MEMTPLTSALAAARVERQQLHDEMATLRANYHTKSSKLADDFMQEDSELRGRIEASNDRVAVLRLRVEQPESSSQPALKRTREHDYDFAPVAPERLQPAPTRPPVFANWSEDGVEQPKSLPTEVPRMELEDGVEQPKSLPAEVPRVELEDEVEQPQSLPTEVPRAELEDGTEQPKAKEFIELIRSLEADIEALWINDEDYFEVELEDGVELIVSATLIGA